MRERGWPARVGTVVGYAPESIVPIRVHLDGDSVEWRGYQQWHLIKMPAPNGMRLVVRRWGLFFRWG